MKNTIFLMVILHTIIPVLAQTKSGARDSEWQPLRAKTLVMVDEYDKSLGAFHVSDSSLTAVGPLYADPCALLKAIDSQEKKFSESSLAKWVGSEFSLSHELPLLSQSELDKRKSKPAPKSRQCR